MIEQLATSIGVIESAGIPALRVVVSLLVVAFIAAGFFIFRKRHQFFDRDPDVDNDVPVVRNTREEAIIFVWSGLMLVLLSILYQVWPGSSPNQKPSSKTKKRS